MTEFMHKEIFYSNFIVMKMRCMFNLLRYAMIEQGVRSCPQFEGQSCPVPEVPPVCTGLYWYQSQTNSLTLISKDEHEIIQ